MEYLAAKTETASKNVSIFISFCLNKLNLLQVQV